jgi:hypothetical protein
MRLLTTVSALTTTPGLTSSFHYNGLDPLVTRENMMRI